MAMPAAAGASSPTRQPVPASLTRAAIFLVVTINSGGDAVAKVQSLCADLAALLRAVGFREPRENLSCIMGFGSEAWDRLFGEPRPAELHPFREFRAGSRHAVATPGDLLFHIRAERMDLCFELAAQIMSRLEGAVTPVDEVHGFRYFDSRDLLGFVDGTENPTGQDAVDATIIREEDPGFAGGSYVIVQKYLHDMAGWNALPTEAQERIIGRTKLSDIELDDTVKPELGTQRADRDRGERERDQDRPRQHAFRAGWRGRVRHLLHRLQPLAPHDRANAGKHVHRPAAGQLRPDFGFQPGRYRQPLLRADGDLPRRRDVGRAGYDATGEGAAGRRAFTTHSADAR